MRLTATLAFAAAVLAACTQDTTLDPDDPVRIGDGRNTDLPAGDGRTGIDATDELCDQLRRDLNDSIDETLADMRAAGVDGAYLPSRSDLQDQLGTALRANGCDGF